MRHFHYDPFTELGGKANCTVGALREAGGGPRRVHKSQLRESIGKGGPGRSTSFPRQEVTAGGPTAPPLRPPHDLPHHRSKERATMATALSGFRVLEVAAWTFVPAAGAVLADWGADVIKVEHPETGDPQRGLVSMGLIPGGDGAVNYIIEQPNRGKRSIGIDISTDGGRDSLPAGRVVGRVPHQLPSRRAPAVEDRRRAHPGRQPGHRLRPGFGSGTARSRP